MSGKWLELFNEVAPRVTRAARPDPASSPRSRPPRRRSGVEVSPVNLRDAAEIERALTAFARPRMAV
jgi:putative tryptophan/tyrosine transport system substrate-binding protein